MAATGVSVASVAGVSVAGVSSAVTGATSPVVVGAVVDAVSSVGNVVRCSMAVCGGAVVVGSGTDVTPSVFKSDDIFGY